MMVCNYCHINTFTIMKFNLIAFTFFISLISLKAQDYINQKYDREKLIMDRLTLGCSNLDPLDSLVRIGNIFNFNDDTLEVLGVDTFFKGETTLKFEYYTNCTQISNKEGKFTAFFNGYLLYDRYGNYEELTMLKEPIFGHRGHLGVNRSMILPYPDKDSTYVLFTPWKDVEDPAFEALNSTAIAGIVFRELNTGKLKILDFYPEIINGNFGIFGAMSAVRHANGRDWWIVAPQRLDSMVHTFLFSKEGFSNKSTQKTKYVTGETSNNPEFSPDGQWYTRTHVKVLSQWHNISTIQFYKFSRCSGIFEDQIEFEMDYEDTSNVIQVIFEKNSRYFYITSVLSLYQGDIQSEDIKASLIKVGKSRPLMWDEHMLIGAGFLAPDDKIYIFDGRPNFYGSIINNPSERGLACDFQYEYRAFPACTSVNFGNLPNFNLGPLDGSPCDTLGLDNPLAVEKDTKKHIEYNIYPNPGNILIHTDYNFERKDLKMKLLDFRGKVIMNTYAISLKTGIDISDIAPGVYFVIIEGMPVKKMIKI